MSLEIMASYIDEYKVKILGYEPVFIPSIYFKITKNYSYQSST